MTFFSGCACCVALNVFCLLDDAVLGWKINAEWDSVCFARGCSRISTSVSPIGSSFLSPDLSFTCVSFDSFLSMLCGRTSERGSCESCVGGFVGGVLCT